MSESAWQFKIRALARTWWTERDGSASEVWDELRVVAKIDPCVPVEVSFYRLGEK